MPLPFADQFRTIVEPLFGREFTAADGIPAPELEEFAARCDYELPGALRDFYGALGRFEAVMSSHNRFDSPGSFSRIDGRLVFCEENQVVMYWGYNEEDASQIDPPVYQGVNNDVVEWYLEADRMSTFLAGMIYWQALYGGLPEFRSGNASESVLQAAAAWPLVWQDKTTQLFSRGSLVFLLASRAGSIEIQAAGPSETELEKLWEALGCSR